MRLLLCAVLASVACSGSGGAPCEPATPVARGVHYGDYYIRDPASALAARSLRAVEGTLRVMPSFSGELDLPDLIAIGDSLDVASLPPDQSQITRLRAQNLISIGADLWVVSNPALVEIDLWKLEIIGRTLRVQQNPVLDRLGLDSLGQVGGPTTNEITDNARLPDCLVNAIYAAVGWSGTSTANGGPTPTCETTACGRLVPAARQIP